MVTPARRSAHLWQWPPARPGTSPRGSRAARRVSVDYYTRLERGYVRNGRMDILAANQLGYALYSEMFLNPRRPVNSARFAFLDPRAPGFFVDRERVTDDAVAVLRAEAGSNPHDRDLSDLIGELSTQSEDHDTGTKHLHHPIVGDLMLSYEALAPIADSGLTMFAYTAEPGSKSEESLNLLVSWAATIDQEQPETVPEPTD